MVNLFVGITDWDWFDHLRSLQRVDEVNFWQPGGGKEFHSLRPGELFLFKLHAPRNYIVGGGVYLRSDILPLSLAWDAFGEMNGCSSLAEMRTRIGRYRKNESPFEDYRIGCRILVQPFFFPEERWLHPPASWARQIVVGKTFSTENAEGRALWESVGMALASSPIGGLAELPQERYGAPTFIKPRLGQGSFRIAVTDAYSRRCAVSGERTLPALEAGHIRPYAFGGEHEIPNGLLLRRDIHTLFDRGYVTVSPAGTFEVSKRIKEEYENGRHYYAMAGQKIQVPTRLELRPSGEFLEWHNNNVFLG